MKWLKKLSLYYKINGIIIASLLVLSVIIGAVMIKTTANLLTKQIDRRGIEIGTSLAVLSSNDILLDDHYSLFERINKTKNTTEDVRYIVIIDYAGRLLAHTFGNGLPYGLPFETNSGISGNFEGEESGVRVTVFDSNEGPIREVTIPIENGSVGFVRVGMSEISTQKLLLDTAEEFFLLTLLICILAVAGATHLAHYIVQPIQSLAGVAQQIRQGNYAVQACVQEQDEVGRLALVFNDMAASLKKKETENNQLLEELRAKEAMRATLMNKIVTVQEDERKRISRELHDETGQSLASLLAYMKLLQSKLTEESHAELLLQARNVATSAMGQLRKMAVELRPPILDDLGITAAMAQYIENYRTQHNCRIEFLILKDNMVLDDQVSLSLYRILQEGLTNIAKHAQATDIWIALDRVNTNVVLTIRDNGRGMDASELSHAYRDNRLGIHGMRERTELLGGCFDVSSQPDGGTMIRVILPMRLE